MIDHCLCTLVNLGNPALRLYVQENIKDLLGYLEGRDCCGHYKPTKLLRRMTGIRLVTTGGIFVIGHIV